MIISIANQKGGVGKTTTVYNLAYELKKLNKKVLCFDLDLQSNLTLAFNINKINYSISNLFDFILEDKNYPHKKEYIHSVDGIDIIPSTIELSKTDNKLKIEIGSEQILNLIIQKIKNDYDYILLDLSPSLNSLTINALACSDSVLIPVVPERFAIYGFQGFLESIFAIKKRINRNLKIQGILFTMIDKRLILHKKIKKELQIAVENKIKIFKTNISKSTEVAKSINESKPISQYNPSSKIATEYKNLAEEIVYE